MKRQWKAPADNVKESSQFDGIVSDQKRDDSRGRYNQRHNEGGQTSIVSDGKVPEGLGLSGNFGNEFQDKQDKFDGDFVRERGLFGTELPEETKTAVAERVRKESESPDTRQKREPSQEKKEKKSFFGKPKKNVSNPFPTAQPKKEPMKAPVTLGNLGPATDIGGGIGRDVLSNPMQPNRFGGNMPDLQAKVADPSASDNYSQDWEPSENIANIGLKMHEKPLGG